MRTVIANAKQHINQLLKNRDTTHFMEARVYVWQLYDSGAINEYQKAELLSYAANVYSSRNKKPNDVRVQIGALDDGDCIRVGGIDFKIISRTYTDDYYNGVTGMICLSREVLCVRPFDSNGNVDWKESELRRYLNEEFVPEFEHKIGVAGALIPFTRILTADDGSKSLSICEDKISILSANEYRNNRHYISRKDIGWWTLTSWGANDNSEGRVSSVRPDGRLGFTGVTSSKTGVVIVCRFAPTLPVEVTELYEDAEYSNKIVLSDTSKDTNDKLESDWSDYINSHIASEEQLAVYQSAGLMETMVLGRHCLIRKINLNYVSPQAGISNRDLMRTGKAPFDSGTGERIVLHHMEQDYDGPIAELSMFSEHSGKFESVLHSKTEGSWRTSKELKHKSEKERKKYWKERLRQLEENDAE